MVELARINKPNGAISAVRPVFQTPRSAATPVVSEPAAGCSRSGTRQAQ